MPRRCGVCTHANVAVIDAAIQKGYSFRQIARRFGLSKSSVARHAHAQWRPDEAVVAPSSPTSPAPCAVSAATNPPKTYHCRYPRYKIGERIQFVDGLFTTTDLDLQRLIERNPWYGTNVVLDEPKQDGPEAL